MKKQKYYTIYRTINLVNNKEYIGQHITDNPNDSYIGSGVLISNAIKKYGKHNFKKEILHVFDSYDEMNQKEIELVNIDYVLRDDTYNVLLGGAKWNTKNSAVVRNKLTGALSRIYANEFDDSVYEYITKNKLVVRLIGTNKNVQINCNDFDETIHEHVSKNRIVVRNKITGETSSLQRHEYDKNEHESVFGGIVVEKDGKNCYISRDEYYSSGLKVKSYGKLVVIDSVDNTVKQIDKNLYHLNRARYTTPSTGFVCIRHKTTGNTKRIHKNDITDELKQEYFLSTGGNVTVLDKESNKYINVTINEYQTNQHKYLHVSSNKVVVFDITKKDLKFHSISTGEYDSTIHKLPKDIKIKILNEFDDVIFEYWGSKRKVGEQLFELLKTKITKSIRSKFFNGELFLDDTSVLFKHKMICIDWKTENELSRKA